MRSALPGGWEAHRAEIVERLRAVRPLAEERGVTLAVENHQDATSADALAALARLGPLVRNIHLSDYTAYPTSQGWRLVRCALGEGDLNLRGVFAAIERHAPQAPCQIELVSHTARHVRLLEDEWWRGYPPRDVRDLLPVLRLFAQTLRSRDDDWRTPWERGAPEAQIAFYEDQQYASSVSYLRSIGALPRL
jgi:3-oxoisoapionate decarboxylase